MVALAEWATGSPANQEVVGSSLGRMRVETRHSKYLFGTLGVFPPGEPARRTYFLLLWVFPALRFSGGGAARNRGRGPRNTTSCLLASGHQNGSARLGRGDRDGQVAGKHIAFLSGRPDLGS